MQPVFTMFLSLQDAMVDAKFGAHVPGGPASPSARAAATSPGIPATILLPSDQHRVSMGVWLGFPKPFPGPGSLPQPSSPTGSRGTNGTLNRFRARGLLPTLQIPQQCQAYFEYQISADRLGLSCFPEAGTKLQSACHNHVQYTMVCEDPSKSPGI